jgi:nucleotide-binding universal stress UspA family protein
MSYRTILAPLKMEEVDELVVEQAVYVARLCGASVTLLVVDHIHTRDAGAYLRERSQAYLAEKMAYAVEQGVPAETLIREGEPEEEILRAVDDIGADLVVMGSHGHSHVRHLLLGSVTEAVLRTGEVPVLLVKARKGG